MGEKPVIVEVDGHPTSSIYTIKVPSVGMPFICGRYPTNRRLLIKDARRIAGLIGAKLVIRKQIKVKMLPNNAKTQACQIGRAHV